MDNTSESQGDSISSSSPNPNADILSIKCNHRYINVNIFTMNFKYIFKSISIYEYFNKIKIIVERTFRRMKHLLEEKYGSSWDTYE